MFTYLLTPFTGDWQPQCPTINETLKWLLSLPILMQETFWWWQCSDRCIIAISVLCQPSLCFACQLMNLGIKNFQSTFNLSTCCEVTHQSQKSKAYMFRFFAVVVVVVVITVFVYFRPVCVVFEQNVLRVWSKTNENKKTEIDLSSLVWGKL